MSKQNIADRLNESLELNDKLVGSLHRMSRLLGRVIEDAEEQVELAGEIIDQYDRAMTRWAEEDEDDNDNV